MTAPKPVGPLAIAENSGVTYNAFGEDSTGTKIWDAGRALCDTLTNEASTLANQRVLELGSGTGIGGLAAASAGAAVVLTDGESATLPLLEANVKHNRLSERSDVCLL